MRLRKTLLWAAAMLMLGGCSEKASDAAPAGTPAATATAAQAAPAMSPAAQPQHVAVEVPTPGKVLNDVYGMKGDGSESYTIDNGATATFGTATASTSAASTTTPGLPMQGRANTANPKRKTSLIPTSG